MVFFLTCCLGSNSIVEDYSAFTVTPQSPSCLKSSNGCASTSQTTKKINPIELSKNWTEDSREKLQSFELDSLEAKSSRMSSYASRKRSILQNSWLPALKPRPSESSQSPRKSISFRFHRSLASPKLQVPETETQQDYGRKLSCSDDPFAPPPLLQISLTSPPHTPKFSDIPTSPSMVFKRRTRSFEDVFASCNNFSACGTILSQSNLPHPPQPPIDQPLSEVAGIVPFLIKEPNSSAGLKINENTPLGLRYLSPEFDLPTQPDSVLTLPPAAPGFIQANGQVRHFHNYI
ncbi:hypothetical protein O181_090329 [Austropuccinia psidii MF-1]|uniref:Uncharacterized protein n=1 Tax=Austropuccinia psidii MF-1 TaxID=1389203 RepID=A0A9Q3IVE3_9BASI|nr:hypothetical protein [Austropuccinia psidii MF-1]